jgi:hypothetical protein
MKKIYIKNSNEDIDQYAIFTLGKKIRCGYDITNYVELTVQSDGSLIIHNQVGVNDSIIIDKTEHDIKS